MITTIKSIVGLFLFRLLSRGSSFLTLLIYARYFSPEEFGFYGLIITTTYTAISFGTIGLRHSYAYFIGNGDKTKRLFNLIFMLSIFLGIITSFFLFGFFTHKHFPSSIIFLSCFFAFCLLIFTIIQGGFLGFEDIKSYKNSEFFLKLSTLIFSFLFVLFFDRISLVISVYILILSVLIALLYSLIKLFIIYTNLSINKAVPTMKSILRVSIDAFSFGFPICVVMGLSLLNPLISLYAAKSFLDIRSVALLFFCLKITEIIIEAAKSATTVVFSKGVNIKTERFLFFLSARISWWLIYLSFFSIIILSLVLPLLAPFLENVIFDSVIFLILSLSLPFISFSKTISSALLSKGHQGICVAGQLIGVLLNVFILFTRPQLTIELIAIALVSSQVLTSFLFLFILCKKLNLTLTGFFMLGFRELKIIISIFRDSLSNKKL